MKETLPDACPQCEAEPVLHELYELDQVFLCSVHCLLQFRLVGEVAINNRRQSGRRLADRRQRDRRAA